MFILSAMTMLAAVSCTKEITNETNGSATGADLYPMTFTANSQQTKAELVDGKFIHWESGDQINVFDNTETVYDPFETSDKGSQATFSGMAGKAEGYYALYPYQSDASMTEGAIIATFPSEQTAVAGSFDPQAFIAVAQSDNEGNFSFKNVAALVQFTMPEGENATSATLTANADNEKLCGPVKITFDENGNPSTTAGGKMTNAVTLKGTLEAGKTYYFVVRPGIAFSEGLTISIDGKKYRVSSVKPEKTLIRNSVMSLPAFTFKEGMPKDLYTAYEHGFDLQIGGQKFDKATYGEATLITNAITAPNAGIYFLNPEIEQPMGSNIEHMAIIGRYAGQKSILTRTGYTNVKATSDGNNYMIIANVNFIHTSTSNYIFTLTGSNNDTYEKVIFDNVEIEMAEANKQIMNMSGTRTFSGIFSIVNSDILINKNTDVTLVNFGVSGTSLNVTVKNNVMRSTVGSTDVRIFSVNAGLPVESLVFDSNTLIDLLPYDKVFMLLTDKSDNGACVGSVKDNLFYMSNWNCSANQYILRLRNYTPVSSDPIANGCFENNHSYYGTTETSYALRSLYSSGVNPTDQLASSPFTADQIAQGNFALPEGTAYGAKR